VGEETILQEKAAAGPQEPSYWRETRQPIYSAVVVLPFLLVYELGVFLLRSDEINGGDAILQSLGGQFVSRLGIGLGAGSISILVLVVYFIGAQIFGKGTWRLRSQFVMAAFFESLVYAVILFMLLGYLVHYLPSSHSRSNHAQNAMLASAQIPIGATDAGPRSSAQPARVAALQPCAGKSARPSTSRLDAKPKSSSRAMLRDFVLYCGAGVYEELVFRAILLSLLLLVFHRLFHMETAYAAAWAVLVGSIIFSGFHHIGGEPFEIGRFMQRVFAGLYFSVIYYNRSFGIAVASHALYDILIGLTTVV
jgi:hypothetical protein